MLINKIRFISAGHSLVFDFNLWRAWSKASSILICFAFALLSLCCRCGGYCFLMLLQRVGIGIAVYDRIFYPYWTSKFIMVFTCSLAYYSFSKFCVWICPFSLLDA